MKSMHIGNIRLWLGAIAMFLGSAGLVHAAALPAATGQQSHDAAWLYRAIKADAMQVRSAAFRLENLTMTPHATWMDYDGQWNAIKPSVEDMQIKLVRLEALQASSAPAQRKELDQSRQLIQEIQSRTHGLRVLLDRADFHKNDPRFKEYARGLTSEAGRLERAAKVS
jgi:hypothetical protein